MSFSRADLASANSFLTIRRLQRRQIALDARLDLIHPLLQLGAGEVLISGVDRLELAAVDRRHRMGEQVQPPTHLDKLSARRADRRTVVLPEVCDGLEVWRQPSGQPHQLDIAAGLPLKPSTRSNLIDVAVNVDLQQHARMI